MNKRSTWISIIAGAVLVGLLLACLVGGLFFPLKRAAGPVTVVPGALQGYASNGETIYFTGVNDRGQRKKRPLPCCVCGCPPFWSALGKIDLLATSLANMFSVEFV